MLHELLNDAIQNNGVMVQQQQSLTRRKRHGDVGAALSEARAQQVGAQLPALRVLRQLSSQSLVNPLQRDKLPRAGVPRTSQLLLHGVIIVALCQCFRKQGLGPLCIRCITATGLGGYCVSF